MEKISILLFNTQWFLFNKLQHPVFHIFQNQVMFELNEN